MKLYILSLQEAIQFEPKENEKTALIRIHDIDYPVKPLLHEDKFHSILDTFFSDVIREIPEEAELFTSDHAKEVIQFINDNKEVDTFVVHCHSGVSRSASIAMSLSWILGNQKMENAIIESKRYSPNPFVMTILAKELMMEEEKKDIIEKSIIGLHSTNEVFAKENTF